MNVVTAPIEELLTRFAAKTLSPPATQQLLAEKTMKVIQNSGNVELRKLPAFSVPNVEFSNFGQAEIAVAMTELTVQQNLS